MAVSKHYTTQCNNYDKVKEAIYSTYRSVRIYHPSISKFLRMKTKRIHEHPANKNLTQYFKGKLSGIEDCLFRTLQNEWVEWKLYYTNKNGKVVYVKKWQQLPLYIQNNGNFNGNFFWNETTKPFGNNPSTGKPKYSEVRNEKLLQ